MKKALILLFVVIVFSCQEENKVLTANEIVNKSIEVSGGDLYDNATISFEFRGKQYISEMLKKQKTLKRIQKNDSINLVDILTNSEFKRLQFDTILSLSDSLKTVYGNSVNSVHYFAKLPYGLNERAVNKELLGKTQIKDKTYHKLKVTFNEEGGGDDFDDTYVYFINTNTYKVDYLAYHFHVNGGGIRFREAINERYINGIRIVDYNNQLHIVEKQNN